MLAGRSIKKLSNNATKASVANKQQKRNLEMQLGGGRASDSGIVATVFGSTGFLGRYTVNKFGRIGSQVVIPYRSAGGDHDIQHLKVMGDVGQIVPVLWNVRNPDTIYNAVKHSNVVINLVGRKFDTRNFQMEETHIESARRIAAIAKDAGVDRFVHVSTAQFDPDSECKWIRTKSQGEIAVREVFEGSTIIRSTDVFGPEDKFVNSMGQMIRYWPAVPLLAPHKKIQPVYADDVAEAIISAISRSDAIGKTYTIGGPKVYTNQQFASIIAKATLKQPWVVQDPHPKLMQFLTTFLERHRIPRFTQDSLKNRADSIVPEGALTAADLGVTLTPFEDKVLNLVRHYREPARQEEIVEVA